MKTITYTDPENQLYTYEISCLYGRDVLATRPLWEEVFYEDSPAFTEYYFSKKAASNITFVCRLLSDGTAGEIISMVHLTPYEVTIKGKSYPTFYIVGVATRETHRHRGLMAALLSEAFDYAAKQLCPFVFLMPANPAIYEPFGFSYIYSRTQYDVPEIIGENPVYINLFPMDGISVRCMEAGASPSDLNILSEFAGRTLSEQFDYYLTRTPSYYETLLSELKSENGCLYAFFMENRIEGYFLYAKENNTPFVQELLFSERLRSRIQLSVLPHPDRSRLFPTALPQKKPIIMAKNLHTFNHENELSQLRGFINEIV